MPETRDPATCATCTQLLEVLALWVDLHDEVMKSRGYRAGAIDTAVRAVLIGLAWLLLGVFGVVLGIWLWRAVG